MKNLSTRWLTMMLGTVLGFRGKAPAKKTKGSTLARRHYDGLHTRKTRDSRPPQVRYSKENGQ